MKIVTTSLGLLFMACFSISCSNDDDTPDPFTALEGHYKITVFELENPMDLNDDGTASTDVFSELPEYFNHPSDDLELKRGAYGYHLINFALPHPNPAYEGEPFFQVSYSRCGFLIRYKGMYPDGGINFSKEGNPEYYEEWGDVQHMEVLPDGTLTCTLFKKYYDFQADEMKSTSVYLEYVRME